MMMIGKSLLLGSAAAALEDMLAYTLLLGYLLYLPAADASLAALMALLPMDLTHEARRCGLEKVDLAWTCLGVLAGSNSSRF